MIWSKYLTVTASPASVRPALNRRAICHLHRARLFWERHGARISSANYLTDQQRDVLHPLVRHWSVRYTAVPLSRMIYAQAVMVIPAAAVCLLGPVAVAAAPAVRALAPGGLLLASMVYLSIFGVVSTCCFRWFGRRARRFFLLGILGTGASIVTASIVVALVPHPWKALQFGVVAGALAVPIIVLVILAFALFGSYIWIPLHYRYVAKLPPSVATAVLLWDLADNVNDVTVAWRQDSRRRELITRIQETTYSLEWRMPRAMRVAGYSGPSSAEALRRDPARWQLRTGTGLARDGRQRSRIGRERSQRPGRRGRRCSSRRLGIAACSSGTHPCSTDSRAGALTCNGHILGWSSLPPAALARCPPERIRAHKSSGRIARDGRLDPDPHRRFVA